MKLTIACIVNIIIEYTVENIHRIFLKHFKRNKKINNKT